jgi:ankyrin repeat protein
MKTKNVDATAKLFNAVILNDVKEVKAAIKAGADINDYHFMTPLHFAAQGGHLAIVKFLVEKGADIKAKDDDWTPLHVAARHGDLSMVKFLVENGADINAKTDSGATVLHWAAREGHSKIVGYLRSQGAKE